MKRCFAVMLCLWLIAGCGGVYVKYPMSPGEVASAPVGPLDKRFADTVKSALVRSRKAKSGLRVAIEAGLAEIGSPPA